MALKFLLKLVCLLLLTLLLPKAQAHPIEQLSTGEVRLPKNRSSSSRACWMGASPRAESLNPARKLTCPIEALCVLLEWWDKRGGNHRSLSWSVSKDSLGDREVVLPSLPLKWRRVVWGWLSLQKLTHLLLHGAGINLLTGNTYSDWQIWWLFLLRRHSSFPLAGLEARMVLACWFVPV